MDIQRFANSLYLLIEHQQPIDGLLEGYSGPLKLQSLNDPERLKNMLDHHRLAAIKNRWWPAVEQGALDNFEDSLNFVRDMMGAFHSVDGLVDFRCTADTIDIQAGSWNDSHYHRPRQSGWSAHLSLTGAGVYHSVRREFEAQTGDLVLFAPSALQDFRRSPAESEWKLHWLGFAAEARFSTLLGGEEMGPGCYRIRFGSGDEFHLVSQLFEQMRALCEAPLFDDPNSVALRQNLCEQLLLRAKRISDATGSSACDERIERLMAFISAELAAPLNIAELASRAHCSQSTLSRRFKAHTGLSIKAWREERRIASACEQLTHGLSPIGTIAEQLGYSDPLYFSRSFKAHMGCSPRHYRKRLL